MARPFNSTDARRIIDQGDALCGRLESAKGVIGEFKESISRAIDKYAAHELMRVLSDIPVDELNRDKCGIRIGALKEAGVRNIADVTAMLRTPFLAYTELAMNPPG